MLIARTGLAYAVTCSSFPRRPIALLNAFILSTTLFLFSEPLSSQVETGRGNTKIIGTQSEQGQQVLERDICELRYCRPASHFHLRHQQPTFVLVRGEGNWPFPKISDIPRARILRHPEEKLPFKASYLPALFA